MTKEEIDKIPQNKTVTHARITADYREEKEDLYCIRIALGGNLINYSGPTTSTTADIITLKLLWNSVISTPDSKYICLDVKNYYLQAPLKDCEYIKMNAKLIPEEFIKEYKLTNKIVNGYIYMKIIRVMYDLPQSG